MTVLRQIQLLLLMAAAFAASGRPAVALERVTLHNGFSYDCVRLESLPNGQVRLYLSTGQRSGTGETVAAAEANFVELPAERIASVDRLPDPPTSETNASGSASPSLSAVPSSRSSTLDVRSLLAHAGSTHNIDIELLASLVHAESNGRATAVSRTGARGLMQLMPGTAHDLQVGDAFNPEDNIGGGTAYLDSLLRRYHDNLALALAAYNAGPAAVDRFHGIPPFRETRAYVARIMTEFKRRKAAAQALNQGATRSLTATAALATF